LARISTPTDALDLAERAARAKQIYQAIGASVEECNEYAEVYLRAYWKFGEFVKGIPEGRPSKKLRAEAEFPGTDDQRTRGRKFQSRVKETDIPDYIREASAKLESASITGCIEWIDPGRHGNLKGEYEWYTPTEIIEAARDVLGGIDLDPASCDEAQETVKAAQFFTEEDNGLERDWSGRVFLNPPFAHPTVKYFAEKLLASFSTGAVPQAVYLSNACTDTGWWQGLAARGVVCFPEGRIRFKGPLDQGQSPTLGQTLIYLGENTAKFREVFSGFGVVLWASPIA
jgi:phage N-6-adenine-methyltransferase